MLFFRYVVGDPGVDASLPIFAFIFLVALGVDYTIFLMSRVREEARRHGTARVCCGALARDRAGHHERRAGARRDVLGPDDAAGHVRLQHRLHGRRRILLDTFVVRTIMLPAAVEVSATGSGGPRTRAAACARCAETRRDAARAWSGARG
jgi:RND superfamily putative drug exporter